MDGESVQAQSEHEDQRPRVQPHSDVAPEPTPESSQDDGDTDEPAQSKKSRGKLWCSCYAPPSSALTVTS